MLKRYMVAREIGLGPVATTHLAIQHGDAGLRRPVVAKTRHSVVGIEHLFRRCRTLATVEHHNLARILDQGIDRDRPVVIYDYVVGESVLSILGRCVRRRQPVPAHLAARIAADTCAALHAGHTASSPDGTTVGVLHAAVRPSNVMVSYGGCTKLVDYGVEDPERLTGDADFSAAQAQFAAPELLRGGPADERADAYSAAVLLYAMLTLRYPYDEHRSAAKVLQAKEQQSPVPPSARSTAVPLQLERLLLDAISCDPERRPQSAEELQRALERVLGHTAAPSTGVALADFVTALFGQRVAAKRAALRALLSMPPGTMLPGDTTVEVVAPEIDGRAYTDTFVLPTAPTTDVELLPSSGADLASFDGPPTIPEVETHRTPTPGPDYAEPTDPDSACAGEDEEDTAVRRSR